MTTENQARVNKHHVDFSFPTSRFIRYQSPVSRDYIAGAAQSVISARRCVIPDISAYEGTADISRKIFNRE